MGQQVHFLKNVSLLGGLFAIIAMERYRDAGRAG
jgi:hypothetical protein